jgi:GTP cyclohydrolase I
MWFVFYKRRKCKMKSEIRKLLVKMGEDPDRAGLRHTPVRVEKSLQFLTQGYKENIKKLINNAIFEEDCNDMVIVKDIEFYSMCEHHMLPFYGKCHIGYIPNGKIFGVSKLARIVDCFARRLQLQERLTRQIADTILESVNPEGVGVVMEAQHMCMRMRGVEKQESMMVTSSMLGSFRKEQSTRMEFLNLIKK